jgi:methionyl-tRNA formyltransferase
MKKLNELRFAVLGRIVYTDHFVKELSRKGFPKPVVIVSPDSEYRRDRRIFSNHGLFGDLENLENEGLCELHKYPTVNCKEVRDLLLRKRCNIAISINCRNIVKSPLIEFFDGNIFNVHDSYLPNERGGALVTWRILNNITTAGNTIHYLEEGVDTGPIVLRRKFNISKENPMPIDFLKAEYGNCKELLSEFTDLVLEDDIPSFPQDNDKSLYFPRLFTEVNGAIDWDWHVVHIERFIRAFGSPYPGAFSYFREKRVHILASSIDNLYDTGFHPFANGKIVTLLDDGRVRVVAGCKTMIIDKISVDGLEVEPADFFELRFSMYTPIDQLNDAKLHVPTTVEMNENES